MRKIAVLLAGLAASIVPALAKDTLLINRIAPSKSELYVANADGSGAHKLLSTEGYDYHASYSADGKWIVFTSERPGLGQSDIYRVKADGTGLERLTNNPGVDDEASFSPDGSQIAFVSTRATYKANIWILDLKSKKLRNLTGAKDIQGDPMKPDGFYHPAYSPDGKWIAFTSDRNTEWKGHDNGAGWEHLQELAIYIVHPDGTGLKQVTKSGLVSGSPQWSADSKTIFYYEGPVALSWLARVDQLSKIATSQIVSLNIDTNERKELTSGPGLKLAPHVLPGGNVGYTTKSAQVSGVAYTNGTAAKFPDTMRSPSWSPDGKLVVYENIDNHPWKQNLPLAGWDAAYDYRYTDVFPSFSKDGTLLVTNKDVDSSVVTMSADGSNKKLVFKSSTHCPPENPTGVCGDMTGVAFAPAWSPDGQWIVFGYGGYLRMRNEAVAKILMIKRDGTGLQEITNGKPNAGFPSFSPDGKEVVYRSWGTNEEGLRIMNLETKQVRVLTKDLDNLPGWSGSLNRIVFTRKGKDGNFDIYTIKPDGTDLLRVTNFPASDAHAVWSWDGKRIMWDASDYGFKDEAALYDNSFQPYGSVWIMNADGSGRKQLTDSHWEDSMPCIVPPSAKH